MKLIDERIYKGYHKSISVTGEEAIMSSHKGKQQQESVAQTIKNLSAEVLDWVVCIYMFFILAVMPFYHQEGYSHIGTDKSYFFRQCSLKFGILVLPLLALYFIGAVIVLKQEKKRASFSAHKWLEEHFSVTDWFALFYGASVLASYVFSAYKEEAFIGTRGWYMGMLPHLTLVAIYFLISRMWKREKWVVWCGLLASAAVFALGILNCFGIHPIDMKIKNNLFISTIGNVNWYCGYLTAIFFGGLALFWQMDRKKWQYRLLLTLYVLIGFVTLVIQGSSSGILALAAVLFVMFCLSAEEGRLMQAFWEAVLILSMGCLACWLIQLSGLGKLNVNGGTDGIFSLLNNSYISLFMTIVSCLMLAWVVFSNHKNSYPASIFKETAKMAGFIGGGLLLVYVLLLAVNTLMGGRISQALQMPQENPLMFSYQWGSYRGITWYAGIRCFLEQDFLHKLVGAGPDCMSAFLYQDGTEGLVTIVKELFFDNRLTNAHNEWLTILVNEGIFGCISYVGMMCTAIRRFLKGRKISMAAGACGFCVLAYTVNNVFSFQQSMSVATIFIVMGMGESFLREKKN